MKKITDIFTEEELTTLIYNLACYIIGDFVGYERVTHEKAVEKTLEYAASEFTQKQQFTQEQQDYLKSILK